MFLLSLILSISGHREPDAFFKTEELIIQLQISLIHNTGLDVSIQDRRMLWFDKICNICEQILAEQYLRCLPLSVRPPLKAAQTLSWWLRGSLLVVGFAAWCIRSFTMNYQGRLDLRTKIGNPKYSQSLQNWVWKRKLRCWKTRFTVAGEKRPFSFVMSQLCFQRSFVLTEISDRREDGFALFVDTEYIRSAYASGLLKISAFYCTLRCGLVPDSWKGF